MAGLWDYCCNLNSPGVCENCKKIFIYRTAWALQNEVAILVLNVDELIKTNSPINSMKFITVDNHRFQEYWKMQESFAREL